MKSIENLKWRYATKKFDADKKIPQQQLAILVEAFNLTATSYGLQPLHLVVVSDQKVKNSMIEASYGQRQVADASEVLVLCTKEVDESFIENYFNLVKQVRSTPDQVLAPFKDQLTSSFSSKTKDEVFQWAKNQVYIALGNLMAVCAQERIDSCPMEGFIPERIDEILSLKKQHLRSVLLLPVGYRHQEDMFATMKKVRRSQQEMVSHV